MYVGKNICRQNLASDVLTSTYVQRDGLCTVPILTAVRPLRSVWLPSRPNYRTVCRTVVAQCLLISIRRLLRPLFRLLVGIVDSLSRLHRVESCAPSWLRRNSVWQIGVLILRRHVKPKVPGTDVLRDSRWA